MLVSNRTEFRGGSSRRTRPSSTGRPTPPPSSSGSSGSGSGKTGGGLSANAWSRPLQQNNRTRMMLSGGGSGSGTPTSGPPPGLRAPSTVSSGGKDSSASTLSSNNPNISRGGKPFTSSNNNNGNGSNVENVMRERFLHLSLSMVGQRVTITQTNGSIIEGIFHTFTPFASQPPHMKNMYVIKACKLIRGPVTKENENTSNTNSNAEDDDGSDTATVVITNGSTNKDNINGNLRKRGYATVIADGATVIIPSERVSNVHVKSMRLDTTTAAAPGGNPNNSSNNGAGNTAVPQWANQAKTAWGRGGGAGNNSTDPVFRTDTDISGARGGRNHELVAAGSVWTSGADSTALTAGSSSSLGGGGISSNSRADALRGGLEDVPPSRGGSGGVNRRTFGPSAGGPSSSGGGLQGSIGEWDQFRANEQLFAVKATFDENLYTSKLDKSQLAAHKIEEAERLAREIEGTASMNIHIAAERGQKLEVDYDEEDLYSGVLRTASNKAKFSTAESAQEKEEGKERLPTATKMTEQATPAATASSPSSATKPVVTSKASTTSRVAAMAKVATPPRRAAEKVDKPASVPAEQPKLKSTTATPPRKMNYAAAAAKADVAAAISPVRKVTPVAAGAAKTASTASPVASAISKSKEAVSPTAEGVAGAELTTEVVAPVAAPKANAEAVAFEKSNEVATGASPVFDREKVPAGDADSKRETETEDQSPVVTAEEAEAVVPAEKTASDIVRLDTPADTVNSNNDSTSTEAEKKADIEEKKNEKVVSETEEKNEGNESKDETIENKSAPSTKQEEVPKKIASKLRAEAKEFTFNPSAKSFTPGVGGGGGSSTSASSSSSPAPPNATGQDQLTQQVVDPNTGMPMGPPMHGQPHYMHHPSHMGQPGMMPMMNANFAMRYQGPYGGMGQHVPPMQHYHQPQHVQQMQPQPQAGQEGGASSGQDSSQPQQQQQLEASQQQQGMPFPNYMPPTGMGGYYGGGMAMHPHARGPAAPHMGGFHPHMMGGPQVPVVPGGNHYRPMYPTPGHVQQPGGMPTMPMRGPGAPYYPNPGASVGAGGIHYPPSAGYGIGNGGHIDDGGEQGYRSGGGRGNGRGGGGGRGGKRGSRKGRGNGGRGGYYHSNNNNNFNPQNNSVNQSQAGLVGNMADGEAAGGRALGEKAAAASKQLAGNNDPVEQDKPKSKEEPSDSAATSIASK